jgi:hypothetical protein
MLEDLRESVANLCLKNTKRCVRWGYAHVFKTGIVEQVSQLVLGALISSWGNLLEQDTKREVRRWFAGWLRENIFDDEQFPSRGYSLLCSLRGGNMK